MAEYLFSLDEIVSWLRAKQRVIATSDVQLVKIRERTDYLPAAAAEYKTTNAMGSINGWASGEFDFEAVRTADGESLFWRYVKADSLKDLEDVYSDFLGCLRSCGGGHHSA